VTLTGQPNHAAGIDASGNSGGQLLRLATCVDRQAVTSAFGRGVERDVDGRLGVLTFSGARRSTSAASTKEVSQIETSTEQIAEVDLATSTTKRRSSARTW
jgi:hypothetical protein